MISSFVDMLTRSLILSSPEYDLSFAVCRGISNEGGLSLTVSWWVSGLSSVSNTSEEGWMLTLPHCFVILSVSKRALVSALGLWPVKWWQLCAKDIEWWKAAVPHATAFSLTTMFRDASPCTVAVFSIEDIQAAQQWDPFIFESTKENLQG